MGAACPRAVVFDLGGVLIDWDPRHLYRKLFDDAAAMEHFLAEICSPDWNRGFDAGRPFAEGVAELSARHPDRAELIAAFHTRWGEMVAGPIAGTVAHLEALARAGVPLFALTNWSAETFPIARGRFAFLRHFGDIVVSGEVGLVKPDARIYALLLERIGRPPDACLFIDDSAANVEAARVIGLDAVRFEDAARLGAELARRGLPYAAA